MKNKRKFGFTLIELLIVVTIVVVLAVTAFVSYGYAQGKSRDSKKIADFNAIKAAMIMFAQNYHKWPDNVDPAHACHFPTNNPSDAFYGCLAGNIATGSVSAHDGLVTAGLMSVLPSAPQGSRSYAYFGYGDPNGITSNDYAILNTSFEVIDPAKYNGWVTGNTNNWCSGSDKTEYCMRIILQN